MNKKLKLSSIVLSFMLAAGTLAGCGGSTSTSASSDSGKLPTGQTITVWSHLNEDEVAIVKQKAEDWAKKTKNNVNVIKDNGKFQSLVTAAKSSSGPDIIYGTPHDNLGQYVQANVAATVPSGTIDTSKYDKSCVEAGVFKAKQYGVPVLTETYTLFYNKDKVQDSEVPKTWDDLMTLGKKVGLEFDINNFYYAYCMMAGNGAYVFKDKKGTYDPKDMGLGGDSTVAGLKMVKAFIDQGIMKPSVTGDIAKGDFTNKKIGLYITGPWDISGDKGFKKSGIKFGTTKLPTINGKDTPSFMGVQIGVVNKNTKNAALSWNLVKYLQDNSLTDLEACGRLSVRKDVKNTDEATKGLTDQLKNAQPMPNIPEMSALWTPTGNALTLVTSGKQTPEDAAKSLKDNINKAIAAAND